MITLGRNKSVRSLLLSIRASSYRLDETKPVYNDDDVSAALFSKVRCSGDRLPPPDTLVESKIYADMSLRGTKVSLDKIFLIFLSNGSGTYCLNSLFQFVASINKITTAYDADA